MAANDSKEYIVKVQELRVVINKLKRKAVAKYGSSAKKYWSK